LFWRNELDDPVRSAAFFAGVGTMFAAVAIGFVTGGICSVLPELAEEVLDQVTRLVHFLVKGALDLSIALGRNMPGFDLR
jgi:hypothetical protein